MPGSILVTGATGFVGGHLLRSLADSASAVVAWHRPGSQPLHTPEAVHWEAVDILDRSVVRSAIARTNPSIVFHCAGAAHVGRAWTNSEGTFAVNVRGTHYVAAALAECAPAARLLVPGSALVYRSAAAPLTETDPLQPSSPYGLSKLAQELAATAGRGVAACLARAFNHFGPGQDPAFAAAGFAQRIAEIEAGRSEPEVAVGNLDARRDMTDVRDTVRAYRLIALGGVPGRAYNVCSGRAIVIGDLLELMLSRARLKIRIRVDESRYRPNDLPLLVGDPTRIHEELGWTPEIPLEQTIDDLLAEWRARSAQST
jgi:GDP-4-dehydro-6-deoxy-D-mannose reductase